MPSKLPKAVNSIGQYHKGEPAPCSSPNLPAVRRLRHNSSTGGFVRHSSGADCLQKKQNGRGRRVISSVPVTVAMWR